MDAQEAQNDYVVTQLDDSERAQPFGTAQSAAANEATGSFRHIEVAAAAAAAAPRHARSASLPSTIVDLSTDWRPPSRNRNPSNAEARQQLVGRTRYPSLGTLSSVQTGNLLASGGEPFSESFSSRTAPEKEQELYTGRRRSQSLWSERFVHGSESRLRATERGRESSVWNNFRLLGYRLARFVFFPPERSPCSVSYTSSTSGGSGSDSEPRPSRKRGSRKRRSGHSGRSFSFDDDGKALHSKTELQSGTLVLSKADSMLSMSSFVEGSASSTPEAVYDASSSSDAEANEHSSARHSELEMRFLPAATEGNPDLESVQSNARFCVYDANEERFSPSGETRLYRAWNSCTTAVGRAADHCTRLLQTVFRGVSTQPPLREELAMRSSLSAKAVFLLRTVLWYLWPVIAWLSVFNFFDVIPSAWKPKYIHVRWIPILESYLLYPHRWFFFGYDHGRGASFLDFLAAFPYTVHAGLPFAFIALLILRRTPARRILQFGRLLGLVSLLGVLTHLFMPTAPPWYYEKFGFRPPDYTMKGDPALLDRIDDAFGIHFYRTMYATAGKVVFGTFPSLHAAWPYLMASFEPQQGRFLWAYTLWVWWAALYLQHHYLLDLIGGALYVEVVYAIAGRLADTESESVPDKALYSDAPAEGAYQPLEMPQASTYASRRGWLPSEAPWPFTARPLTPSRGPGTSRPQRRYRSSSQASSIDLV